MKWWVWAASCQLEYGMWDLWGSKRMEYSTYTTSLFSGFTAIILFQENSDVAILVCSK